MRLRHALLIPAFALQLTACGDDDKPPADTADAADTQDVADTAEGPDTADAADTAAPSDAADVQPDADDVVEVPAREVFAFRAAPGQRISEGPFPNNGVLGPEGTVKLAPLREDERFASLTSNDVLTRTDAQIAKKGHFGYVSSVFFPMNAEPDLATFEGAVHYIALSGPEEGKVFPGQASWFAPARYLTVFPAWGHYLVSGATYGVIIDVGVETKGGQVIEAPDHFAAMIEADGPAPTSEIISGRQAFASLRAWLSTRDQAAVVGTVFTTEPVMPFIDDLLEAADAFELVTPTRHVAYKPTQEPVFATDVGLDELDDYFGTPTGAFATTPTPWSAGSRESAKALNGGAPYTGGSYYGQIGRVINGSIVAPSFNSKILASGEVVAAPITWQDGKPVAQARVMIPFTAFLCREHLKDGEPDPDKQVPFAIFTHGGTALRSDALAFAVANCAAGYATIAMDLPFHGGRQQVARLGDSGDLIVSFRADEENVFTGKRATDAGFYPDHIGDNGAATTTVGSLFGLASNFDPDVLEANLIAISVEAHVLVRYLNDPAMMSWLLGTKVDTSRLVMQSLSFGTSFTTALMAASDDFVGAVQSVGSGGMLTLNLPMAPNNAQLASGILYSLLGLKSTIPELIAGAYRDPVLALLQWLSQRGDPQGYAPFVLRHRDDSHALHVFGSGDSWDETLNSLAQLGFNNAWGIPTFTAGAEWTLASDIPGAATVEATAFSAPLNANLTYGGRTQSAAYFYNGASCHPQVITPVCESSFEAPYPPPSPRATPHITLSPVCALQAPVVPFMTALRQGQVPTIGKPQGTCDDLYGE